ncbi:hypothetical protein ANTHELSMS3_00392 [Antarctobacter heliothermus]|uniref:Uncharacterized protein n=1 Tax=Antarctobacter heliothermus TaxID=74033 RepID=A0A222DYX2_9RHOB|nr:hypothetical protein ANTHELSMS3_00392 [Antarctobacter heliothermus]
MRTSGVRSFFGPETTIEYRPNAKMVLPSDSTWQRFRILLDWLTRSELHASTPESKAATSCVVLSRASNFNQLTAFS